MSWKAQKTLQDVCRSNENKAKINSCVKRCAVIYSMFSKIRPRIQELSLSHDAISCVLSSIESQENPVNTDAFATSENVQIQTQQIPTPPTFPAVEAYEMLQKTMKSVCARRALTSCRSVLLLLFDLLIVDICWLRVVVC